jgi:hypothetical protein
MIEHRLRARFTSRLGPYVSAASSSGGSALRLWLDEKWSEAQRLFGIGVKVLTPIER